MGKLMRWAAGALWPAAITPRALHTPPPKPHLSCQVRPEWLRNPASSAPDSWRISHRSELLTTILERITISNLHTTQASHGAYRAHHSREIGDWRVVSSLTLCWGLQHDYCRVTRLPASATPANRSSIISVTRKGTSRGLDCMSGVLAHRHQRSSHRFRCCHLDPM